MKKLLLLCILLVGCAEKNPDGSYRIVEAKDPLMDATYSVVIDSCEYIICGYKMAHKGNCRYCAERRAQELNDIVELIKNN